MPEETLREWLTPSQQAVPLIHTIDPGFVYLKCPKKSHRENLGDMRSYMRKQGPASHGGNSQRENICLVSSHAASDVA